MAVSDDSLSPPYQAASDSLQHPALASSAKDQAKRPKPDWPRIQYEYEKNATPHRELAKIWNVPYSTLSKRAMRQKWSVKAKLVRDTAFKLESAIGDQIKQEIHDELAPLIEKEKIRITKRGIRIGNRGLSRVEQLWRTKPPTESKHEADGARAAETFLRMARTSLGMSDGNSLPGALTLNVLANQCAVQVTPAA